MSLVLSTKEDAQFSRLLLHTKAVRENWESIVRIKEAIQRDDIGMFLEEWKFMDQDTQIALLRTQGAGGIWCVKEYYKLREWGA